MIGKFAIFYYKLVNIQRIGVLTKVFGHKYFKNTILGVQKCVNLARINLILEI